MICTKCKNSNQTSKVYPGSTTSTLMYYAPFYDERGKYHNHDMNNITTYYSCSNNHHWVESSRPKCPNCAWK